MIVRLWRGGAAATLPLLALLVCFTATGVDGQMKPGTDCPWECSDFCCQNGVCVDNATCVCQPGWETEQCGTIDCNGGWYHDSTRWLPAYSGIKWHTCYICPGNFSGQMCTRCTLDTDCQPAGVTNSTGLCDRSVVPSHRKSYSCEVEGGFNVYLGGQGYLEFLIDGIPINKPKGVVNGSITINVFGTFAPGKNYSFVNDIFLFKLSSCYSTYESKTQTMTYSCGLSSATCSNKASWEQCGGTLQALLRSVKTNTTITCTGNADGTFPCEILQKDLNLVINSNCDAGECLLQPVTPPPPLPPGFWTALHYGEVIGGSAVGLIVIILLCWGGWRWAGARAEEKARARERVALVPDTYRAIHPCVVAFSDLSYSRPVRSGRHTVIKEIFSGVSGVVEPGEVLAVLGPSGAGKTSLMDVLACRKSSGTIQGRLTCNGVDVQSNAALWRRSSAYVLQEDTLMPSMTVRETLMFSAALRLPRSMSARRKEERVEAVLADFGLTHVADVRVGSVDERGVSGGERRRVTIAMEVLTAPSVLFLDEPTSGLDSHSAHSVMCNVRDLARQKRTVVCNIHQPSSQTFHLFDKILLLEGGRLMYFGAREDMIDFFADHALRSELPSFNPADFVLEAISTMPAGVRADMNASAITRATQEIEAVDARGGYQQPSKSLATNDERGPRAGAVFGGVGDVPRASIATQFVEIGGRTLRNTWRDPLVLRAHYGIAVVVAVLLGLIFFRLGDDLIAVQDRFGALFFTCALFSFGSISALDLFARERVVFTRERADGYYSTLVYFLTKVLFDVVPVRVVPPLLFGTISYWMMGLRTPVYHFFVFLALLVLLNTVSAVICLAIGVATRSPALGNLLASMVMLFSMLFGGFLLNRGNMPTYLLWLSYVFPFSYAYSNLMITELNGFIFLFNPSSYNISIDLDAKTLLDQFEMYPDMYVTNFVVLGGQLAFLLILSYVLLWWCVRERR